MRFIVDINLKDFEFWGGAKSTAGALTDRQLESLDEQFEDFYYGCEVDETTINDIFWFEEDTLAEMLGFDDFEALMEHNEAEEG